MVEQMTAIIADVFQLFLNRGSSFLYVAITNLFDWLFGSVNSMVSTAFANPVLKAFFYMANTVSWLILIFSLIFYLLKIAREEKRNWAVIAACPVSAILFVVFNQLLAKLCFILPNVFVSYLNLHLSGTLPEFNFSEAVGGLDSFGILRMLAMAIAGAAFTVVIFMRMGAMFVQMMIAPFYVPSAVTGDTQKVMEWVLGTVSIGFTFLVQYVTFYSGIILWVYLGNDPVSTGIAVALLFSTFSVPKALQKFGWTSGATHSFQAVSMGTNMVSAGLHMIKH